jgi:hypothetical protein
MERFRSNPGRFTHRQVDDVDALCLLCWAANEPTLREDARGILARRHPATRDLPPESLFAAFYAVVTGDPDPRAAGTLVSHGAGSLREEVAELFLRCDRADRLAGEANAKADDLARHYSELAKRLAEQEQANQAQWQALYVHGGEMDRLRQPAWKRFLVRLWNGPSNG